MFVGLSSISLDRDLVNMVDKFFVSSKKVCV